MSSGNGYRYLSLSRVAHYLATFVTNVMHPLGFANDIIVVKHENPDGTITYGCSPVDVLFQRGLDVCDWNKENVNVTVGAKTVWLSMNHLVSSNKDAFHKLPKEKVSETLEKLELQDGMNEVTFSIDEQKSIKARIFLCDRETARFIVADVDGTITKSDKMGVLRHTFDLDWTHKGVASLFSSIANQGYQIIYLSGRAKGFADSTRNFVKDVKQDGKKLPVGPVIVAPEALMDTGIRYVKGTQAVPKIRVLEAILNLWPKEHNPFHAGFGNRRSDRKSYRNVHISEEYIFTINSKGEIIKEVNGKVAAKFNFYNELQKEEYLDVYFPKVTGEPSTSGERGDSS